MPIPLAWLAILFLFLSGCGVHGRGAAAGSGSCPSPGAGKGYGLDLALVEKVERIKSKIGALAGVELELRVRLDPQANAFAWGKERQNQMAVTTGLLELVGDNPDEYAFVIAHEIAHLADHHIQKQEENQTEREQQSGILGFALDLVGMGLGVPLSGMISTVTLDTGSHLAALKYDRDQERRADSLGLQYMIKGGYNPEGAITFLKKLRTASPESVLPILSTHPGGEERIENLTAQLRELSAPALEMR